MTILRFTVFLAICILFLANQGVECKAIEPSNQADGSIKGDDENVIATIHGRSLTYHNSADIKNLYALISKMSDCFNRKLDTLANNFELKLTSFVKQAKA